jgi:KDO2-lipid IV(A) lauroyltransferase
MDLLSYGLARFLLALIRRLPLTVVARLGRIGGELFYWIDLRHRRVARDNLRAVFGAELSASDQRALARENFRRIGEGFLCAARTAQMDNASLAPHLEIQGIEEMLRVVADQGALGCIVAVGHFGNFELYARSSSFMPGYRGATTYRGLDSPRLDGLLQRLRRHSGCLYFERRREADAMRHLLQEGRVVLGLLVDQHAGRGGRPVPFFGRPCSTSTAPAVLALRYHYPLFTAICFRTGLGRWRLEFQEAIPTLDRGQPRNVADICLDINRAFEAAIRRDPANWFWVHRRWKWNPDKPRRRRPRRRPLSPPAVQA